MDIKAKYQNIPYAVQCKRYKDYVAPGVVRDLAGAMQLAGVNHGLLVTTGYVSREARRDARAMNIEIWDRHILTQKTYESTSLRNNPKVRLSFVGVQELADLVQLCLLSISYLLILLWFIVHPHNRLGHNNTYLET